MLFFNLTNPESSICLSYLLANRKSFFSLLTLQYIIRHGQKHPADTFNMLSRDCFSQSHKFIKYISMFQVPANNIFLTIVLLLYNIGLSILRLYLLPSFKANATCLSIYYDSTPLLVLGPLLVIYCCGMNHCKVQQLK